jgi:hypothetical protein
VQVARDVPDNLYEMTACLGRAHLPGESGQVEAMLRTVRFARP